MASLATDNFNRANSGTLGGQFTETTHDIGTGFDIVSNTAQGPGSPSNDDYSAYDSVVSWPNNQYSQAKCTVTGTVGGGAGIGVMLRHALSASTKTMYRIVIDHAASNNVEVAKFIGGTYTALGQRTTAFTNGDTLYAEVQGSTIVVKLNGSALGASFSDSAIASGAPGIAYSSTETSSSLDDWEGGDFSGGGGGGTTRMLASLGVGV